MQKGLQRTHLPWGGRMGWALVGAEAPTTLEESFKRVIVSLETVVYSQVWVQLQNLATKMHKTNTLANIINVFNFQK